MLTTSLAATALLELRLATTVTIFSFEYNCMRLAAHLKAKKFKHLFLSVVEFLMTCYITTKVASSLSGYVCVEGLT